MLLLTQTYLLWWVSAKEVQGFDRWFCLTNELKRRGPYHTEAPMFTSPNCLLYLFMCIVQPLRPPPRPKPLWCSTLKSTWRIEFTLKGQSSTFFVNGLLRKSEEVRIKKKTPTTTTTKGLHAAPSPVTMYCNYWASASPSTVLSQRRFCPILSTSNLWSVVVLLC